VRCTTKNRRKLLQKQKQRKREKERWQDDGETLPEDDNNFFKFVFLVLMAQKIRVSNLKSKWSYFLGLVRKMITNIKVKN
jgi:hypothetical protein